MLKPGSNCKLLCTMNMSKISDIPGMQIEFNIFFTFKKMLHWMIH